MQKDAFHPCIMGKMRLLKGLCLRLETAQRDGPDPVVSIMGFGCGIGQSPLFLAECSRSAAYKLNLI